ncbi:NADH dehydrogenase (ubiquinone) B14.7 subunit [Lycorma delicatula]|uniref:NADH dehydrogenase (ubiquinone) B14.7 subunit n=1 Tax=Lycorma delicatula TaxID=130591 RepID=UPI003F512624
MGYTYYDTPDGEDCGKKLAYIGKKAGLIGIACSTASVFLVDTPSSYFQALTRYARITTPFLATGLAGTAAICLLVGIRKKDDEWNHFYGAFIGGMTGGLAKGHFGHGLAAGAVLAILAGGLKQAKMNNYDLWKFNMKPDYEDFWTKDYDWTITAKRPKDWVAK